MATNSYQNRYDQKNEWLNSYQGDKSDLTHQNTTEHIISTHIFVLLHVLTGNMNEFVLQLAMIGL